MTGRVLSGSIEGAIGKGEADMARGRDGQPVAGRLVCAGLMGIAGLMSGSMAIQSRGELALALIIVGVGMVAGAAGLLCPQRRPPDD